MLCYMGKTWCTFHEDCAKSDTCGRAYTKEVEADANKWWEGFDIEGDPPICQYTNKPDCHEEKTCNGQKDDGPSE